MPGYHYKRKGYAYGSAPVGNPMGAGLGTGVSVHVKSCSQSKEGITTTGAFEGLAISMKTDVDFMQPLRVGDVATDISSTLYFDKSKSGKGFSIFKSFNLTFCTTNLLPPTMIPSLTSYVKNVVLHIPHRTIRPGLPSTSTTSSSL